MPPPPKRPSRPGRTGALLLVGAVILASAGATAWNISRREPPPTEPPEQAAPAAPVPGPEAPGPAAEPVDARRRFLEARAAVACGSAEGEAVFVAPDRAFASIPCAGQARLRLSDGRELLARSGGGAPPGTSVLEVPGAGARFAAPGAASALADGAPLLVGLSGAGPETVAEAAARGLVALDGQAWLRAEDAAGPLAGGVVDGEGRLVAVAPSAPPDPDRPWLAVPVEAFGEPRGVEAPAAWISAREAAADEDRRAQGDLWNRLRRSAVLLGAAPAPSGLALVVARAGSGRPPAETVRLAIDPPVWGCLPAGRIVDWRTGPRALDGLPVAPRLAARVSRLAPPTGGGSVWIGIGSASIDCDLGSAAEGASLSVDGSDPPVRVPIPVETLRPAVADAPPEPAQDPRAAAARAAEEAEEQAAFEEGWKRAFREANARLAEAERRRAAIQAQKEEARGNFQYVLEAQIDADLEVARMEVRRAEEALDDLDRRASLAAVPRAWRRPE